MLLVLYLLLHSSKFGAPITLKGFALLDPQKSYPTAEESVVQAITPFSTQLSLCYWFNQQWARLTHFGGFELRTTSLIIGSRHRWQFVPSVTKFCQQWHINSSKLCIGNTTNSDTQKLPTVTSWQCNNLWFSSVQGDFKKWQNLVTDGTNCHRWRDPIKRVGVYEYEYMSMRRWV